MQQAHPTEKTRMNGSPYLLVKASADQIPLANNSVSLVSLFPPALTESHPAILRTWRHRCPCLFRLRKRRHRSARVGSYAHSDRLALSSTNQQEASEEGPVNTILIVPSFSCLFA